ncbi:MAG: Spo0B domain-containing protein [Clostridia bacterium]|nr:Spo0B domain-containing protein [Clostridia bacterium]MBR1684801.1 Spo0B domain-containing protein [Clostridia bacterium]
MQTRKQAISQRDLDVRKTTMLSIVINAMQILMMLLIVLYLLVFDHATSFVARFLCVLTFVVVASGAVVDIWDALAQRRVLGQIDDMDATIGDLESLNNTIRAQRHDFLNHLQVVYSLMEMEEYGEARDYIETLYGDITAVSRVLKTANPSINALLQVKLAACEAAGVHAEVQIQSRWESLPMPGWEMCKVLSNLIDNAIDALQEVTDRRLTVTLTEDLHAYRFSVANSGPMIPVKSQQSIFQAGVTGKGAGHGMGLYIVRETLRRYHGDIEVKSDVSSTAFRGFVPREIPEMEEKADA